MTEELKHEKVNNVMTVDVTTISTDGNDSALPFEEFFHCSSGGRTFLMRITQSEILRKSCELQHKLIKTLRKIRKLEYKGKQPKRSHKKGGK